MKLFPFACFLLSLATIFPAYAVSYSEQQDNLRIMNRMEKLEHDLSVMQRQIYSGDTPSAAAQPSSTGASANTAQLNARIDTIEEQMRELTGKIEQAEFANNKLNEKIDKLLADNDYRFNALEQKIGTAPAPAAEDASEPQASIGEPISKKRQIALQDDDQTLAEGAIAPTETNPSQILGKTRRRAEDYADAPKATKQAAQDEEEKPKKMNPQEQYNRALAQLRDGQYEEAEAGFKKFLATNSKDPLAGSAYYWLGETYFADKTYDKSAVQYLKSYKEFPKGKKAPDSLLKLSLSLEKLKKKKEACATLGKLDEAYPNAANTIKQKADEASTRLKCS